MHIIQHSHVVCVLVAYLCLILCNPMYCNPPGSSVCGILQTRLLEWIAVPSSRERIFLTQELNPGLLHCRQILYHLSYREVLGVFTSKGSHVVFTSKFKGSIV